MPSQHIYLNDELYQKAKREENLSNLVSRLLEAHYKVTDLSNKSIEEKKLALAKIEAQIEYENKIKEIENAI